LSGVQKLWSSQAQTRILYSHQICVQTEQYKK
jgi:hypothetical protein